MKLVPTVTSVTVFPFQIMLQDHIVIVASGEVPTSGWTHIRLSPRFYATQPADGVIEFSLVGDAPVGPVATVALPVVAHLVYAAPAWVTGVRVYDDQGNTVQSIYGGQKGRQPPADMAAPLLATNVTVRQELAVYDDSFQPTGTIHWDGIVPHAEMKKLRHTLVLNAGGPDENRIRDCINQAIAAGLLAAIVAAVGTGGAALPAAIGAFLSQLQACLGAQFWSSIDDESHWIYWDS